MTSTITAAGVAASLLANPELCTLSTCPLSLANIGYLPSVPGNAFYAALFGILCLAQLFLGVKHRTWGFLVGMCCGTILEIIGYVGRIQMHANPFTQNPFLLYIICLTIAPAFLSASIYLCLARLVPVYSASLSRFAPRTYTLTFIACDFFALVLQGAGGGIASTATTASTTQAGINIMIAGVAWQVFSLLLFVSLCTEFAVRVKRAPDSALDPAFADLRQSTRFRTFLWSLGSATLFIFIRCCYRCAELSQGFNGRLANQQVTFMILEGAMIVLAVVLLTFLHPGVAFQGRWADAGWGLRRAGGAREVAWGVGEGKGGVGGEKRSWRLKRAKAPAADVDSEESSGI